MSSIFSQKVKDRQAREGCACRSDVWGLLARIGRRKVLLGRRAQQALERLLSTDRFQGVVEVLIGRCHLVFGAADSPIKGFGYQQVREVPGSRDHAELKGFFGIEPEPHVLNVITVSSCPECRSFQQVYGTSQVIHRMIRITAEPVGHRAHVQVQFRFRDLSLVHPGLSFQDRTGPRGALTGSLETFPQQLEDRLVIDVRILRQVNVELHSTVEHVTPVSVSHSPGCQPSVGGRNHLFSGVCATIEYPPRPFVCLGICQGVSPFTVGELLP